MTFKVLAIISTLCVHFLATEAKSVTYPGFGTFTDQDFYDPKVRPFVDIPWSPEECDPVFSLYTRKNPCTSPDKDQRLVYDDPYAVLHSNFNASHQTKILVHGFADSTSLGHWMHNMGQKFLELNETNVIIVDWSKANMLPDYVQAVANVRMVGMMIGKLIETTSKATGASLDSFHVLGHSLGSHVAGQAGKYLKGELGRITGFDPAGPEYEGLKDHEGRLWHTDAKFVEAIHTDALPLFPYIGFGMQETCAHVDIFPNGGNRQPGCDQEKITTIIIKGLIDGARALVACNHQRAVDFYFEAMDHQKENAKAYMCENYDQFRNGECTDCGENGQKCITINTKINEQVKDVSYTQGRRFYLATDKEVPYFKHQFLVKISLGPNSDQHGKFMLTVTDENGDTQEFDFQSKEINLHSSKTYGEIFVFTTDPQEITDVEFQWSHNGILGKLFHATIFVDSIEIMDLSTDLGTRQPKTVKFSNPNPEHGIRNDDRVNFVQN